MLACIAFSLFNLDIRVRVRVRLLWVFGSRGGGVETNPIPVVATLAKTVGRHCALFAAVILSSNRFSFKQFNVD